MNFQESKKIEEIISNSKNILLCVHQSPDPDSIVSNVLFSNYLKKINKNHEIVCFDKIHEKFKKTYRINNVIKDGLDINNFDISGFDLLVALDVSEPNRFGFNSDISFKNTINIDHHFTPNKFEGIKIIDPSYSSTTEMLYYFLEDLGYEFSVEDLNNVLMGIITDTDSFTYSANYKVFNTVSEVVKLGGSYEKATEIIYRNNSIDQIKFWSEALRRIKVDKKNKFAYVAMDLKTINKYSNLLQSTRTVADKFIRTIEDTNFGIVMTEDERGFLKISVRSQSQEFGVIELLRRLNGGGHFSGGGGRIDLPYKEAVKEALKIVKKFTEDFPDGSSK